MPRGIYDRKKSKKRAKTVKKTDSIAPDQKKLNLSILQRVKLEKQIELAEIEDLITAMKK